MYAAYASTTTVPTYALHHTLQSLAEQQSRIYSQRVELEAEQRRVQRLRSATLRRLRAERLREAIEEAEIEDIVQQIFEREEKGDKELREAVMYNFQSQEMC